MKYQSFKRPAFIALVMLSSLLVFSIAFAASIVIDTFDVGSQTLEASAGNPTVFGSVINSGQFILGTERDVLVQYISGSVVRVVVGPPNNDLLFSLGYDNLGTAWITYDGVDGSSTLDPDGLCSDPGCTPGGGVDLTDGGTNDSLHFEIVFNNVPFPVEFRVYSGSASDYSYYRVNLPGSIDLGNHVDLLIPLSAFQDVNGGADFTNVGAFALLLDGSTVAGAKLNLDFFEADSFRDFGDAPGSYGGVSHRPNGLRLGSNVDAEAIQLSGVSARDDDTNQAPDDEDGVFRTPGFNWSVLGGGSVDVTMNGCVTTPCYLNGWVDWNQNGSFEPGEQIFSDLAINSNGTATHAFAIGGSPEFDTSYYARFRLCQAQDTCDSPAGSAENGEVEDYLWGFGPTAVVLSQFGSGEMDQMLVVVVSSAVLLVAGLGLYIWVRRRQRA